MRKTARVLPIRVTLTLQRWMFRDRSMNSVVVIWEITDGLNWEIEYSYCAGVSHSALTCTTRKLLSMSITLTAVLPFAWSPHCGASIYYYAYSARQSGIQYYRFSVQVNPLDDISVIRRNCSETHKDCIWSPSNLARTASTHPKANYLRYVDGRQEHCSFAA